MKNNPPARPGLHTTRLLMHASRKLVVLVLLCVGCSAPEPAAAQAPSAAEKSRDEATLRRVAARDLCPLAVDAPSRRANYDAAYKRHERTLDTIAKLDWRTDRIGQAQMQALNLAKLQINRAEVIDLAIALRQDHRPPAGKRVEAAYQAHGPLIERLASDDWETSRIGERDSKALARAGELLMAARFIDLAEVLSNNSGERTAAALAVHGETIRRLAAKNWTTDTPTQAEAEALGDVVAAHLGDVGSALRRMVDVGTTDAVRRAYEARRALLQGLAAKPAAAKVTADEETAVCDVLRIYQRAD